MVRSIRIKEYRFSLGSLTASAGGLFNVYSDQAINGTLQNIYFGDNSYTATGSLLVFASGTGNSGVGINDLFMRVRAGSSNTTLYPFVYPENNQNTTGSPQAFTQPVMNSTLRIVGSGLGNVTSGLSLVVRFI